MTGDPTREKQELAELRAKMPRHVSNWAREIAHEAMSDMDGEIHDGGVYALAQWFDALRASVPADAGTGEPKGAPLIWGRTVEQLRKTIQNEWGSVLCYEDKKNFRKQCDPLSRCRCADIARAIVSEHVAHGPLPPSNAVRDRLADALRGLLDWYAEGCPDGGHLAITEAESALKEVL
jgi:hypothetical protein